MNLGKRVLRRLIKIVRFSLTIPLSFGFALRNRRLRGVRKIFYVATPPPYLPNIGDHAQIIAIRRWMQKHFPDLPVIELDMDQCKWYLPAVRWLAGEEDPILFHSGGNLGDRGIWCESRRRLYIKKFPKNRLISLPQTIYFSDTPVGRKEKENTRRIYATHPDLTIVARDPRSETIASDLFPRAVTFAIPDFVLSLPPREVSAGEGTGKVLLCLRLDNEAALTAEQRERVRRIVPYPTESFDTTFSRQIKPGNRESLLEETLAYFSAFEAVITDRYHGVIFAVICRKPCLVLATVDHKLTSSIHWFEGIPFVDMVPNLSDIPARLERCLAAGREDVPDWNRIYFDPLPARLGLTQSPSGDNAGGRSRRPAGQISRESSP